MTEEITITDKRTDWLTITEFAREASILFGFEIKPHEIDVAIEKRRIQAHWRGNVKKIHISEMDLSKIVPPVNVDNN